MACSTKAARNSHAAPRIYKLELVACAYHVARTTGSYSQHLILGTAVHALGGTLYPMLRSLGVYLHPGERGMQAMAEAVTLALLRKWQPCSTFMP